MKIVVVKATTPDSGRLKATIAYNQRTILELGDDHEDLNKTDLALTDRANLLLEDLNLIFDINNLDMH